MAKLLIVDDTAFMRVMLKNLVLAMGHQVVGEAENGTQAIAQYRAVNPDLVIMDITMPEMDGLSALKTIMEFDVTAKIIICSALGKKDMVAQSFQAGAKDFIVKPYEKERVMHSIGKVLSMSF